MRSFAEILDCRSFDTEQRIVNVSFLELRRIKIELFTFFVFSSSSGLNSLISSDSASSITNLKLSISCVLEDLIVATIKSSNTHDIDNFKLVIEEAESEDIKELRPLLDEKTKNVNNSIFILLSSKNETLTILCSVSKDLQSRISAKDLINALTSPIEGKGGGRVEFAQGAGKPSDREKFVSDIPNIVQSLA